MRRICMAVFIPHVRRYLGRALLAIAQISLTLSRPGFASTENAGRTGLKQENNRTTSRTALFDVCTGQPARADATDFCNEAAVRAQTARTPAPRGKPQSTTRKPCAGIRT
jgi:hypothetical protein